MPPFSKDSLLQKLNQLHSAYSAKSPKTTQYLQSGLPEAQIKEKTAWFPAPLPPEIVALYERKNGFSAPKDSDIVPFQFRDYTFLPLEKTQAEYQSVMDTYGKEPSSAELLAGAFPFAALGGGWLILPAKKQRLNVNLERPVISVFQGISVFFYSVEKMAETCTGWLSHPKHDGLTIPLGEEMEVWRKFNPGIFP